MFERNEDLSPSSYAQHGTLCFKQPAFYPVDQVRSQTTDKPTHEHRGSLDMGNPRANLVLSSIEDPSPTSSHFMRNGPDQIEHVPHKRMIEELPRRYKTPPGRPPMEGLAREMDVVDLTNSRDHHTSKKRRTELPSVFEETPLVAYPGQRSENLATARHLPSSAPQDGRFVFSSSSARKVDGRDPKFETREADLWEGNLAGPTRDSTSRPLMQAQPPASVYRKHYLPHSLDLNHVHGSRQGLDIFTDRTDSAYDNASSFSVKSPTFMSASNQSPSVLVRRVDSNVRPDHFPHPVRPQSTFVEHGRREPITVVQSARRMHESDQSLDPRQHMPDGQDAFSGPQAHFVTASHGSIREPRLQDSRDFLEYERRRGPVQERFAEYRPMEPVRFVPVCQEGSNAMGSHQRTQSHLRRSLSPESRASHVSSGVQLSEHPSAFPVASDFPQPDEHRYLSRPRPVMARGESIRDQSTLLEHGRYACKVMASVNSAMTPLGAYALVVGDQLTLVQIFQRKPTITTARQVRGSNFSGYIWASSPSYAASVFQTGCRSMIEGRREW